MTQVTNENVNEVAPEVDATPADAGVSGAPAPETPAQPEVDVEALRAEYEKKLAQMSTDLNQLKSSLQSREATLSKQYKTRQQQLETQLREVRMKGMDETQRKQYEEQLAREEVRRLQTESAELARKNQEYAALLDAQQFFISKGVPVTDLVLNQGYDALVNSGWNAISAELEKYRKGTQPEAPSKPRKQAPEVVTDKASPSKGTTWKELRARYGSDEAIYQAVENGSLDPSIIPAS